MSFPPQSPSPQQPAFPQSPVGAPRKARRKIRGFVWLFLLALLGGWAITQAPLEIGRWHLARAIKLRGEDNKEAAYSELAAAMERFPKSPELLLQRAEWKLQDGDRDDALGDCSRAIELAGDSPGAFCLRGRLLFKVREFAKAVDDFKKVERL